MDHSIETELAARLQEHYSSVLSQLTRRGMEHAVTQGRIVGVAPLGYRNSFDRPGGKTAVFDEQAPLVRRAWQLAEQGLSLRAILKEVQTLGLTGRRGKRLRISSLHAVLTNPFYAGWIRYKGTLYPGNHKAMISGRLFEKVQRQMQSRRYD